MKSVVDSARAASIIQEDNMVQKSTTTKAVVVKDKQGRKQEIHLEGVKLIPVAKAKDKSGKESLVRLSWSIPLDKITYPKKSEIDLLMSLQKKVKEMKSEGVKERVLEMRLILAIEDSSDDDDLSFDL